MGIGTNALRLTEVHAKDAMIPISNAQDYLAAVKDSQLKTLADVGHVRHEEAPEISLLPVVEFLR